MPAFGTILTGDALAMLRTLPDQSVHCCVTSPPYWGLRDYGVLGQIGLESSPQKYVAALMSIRRYLGIEINPDYVAMAKRRIGQARPKGPQPLSLLDMGVA